jgi:hypothetical protein
VALILEQCGTASDVAEDSTTMAVAFGAASWRAQGKYAVTAVPDAGRSSGFTWISKRWLPTLAQSRETAPGGGGGAPMAELAAP